MFLKQLIEKLKVIRQAFYIVAKKIATHLST